MPFVRVFGNAGLSFLTKLSTGYWNLFDPTNGYTAIDARVAATLPMDQIAKRYFFESDLLFRLGVMRAKVVDLPMESHYGDEESNLSVTNCLCTFPWYHVRNFVKRILYNYFLRNFSVASLNLVLGLTLCGFGAAFGALSWARERYGRQLCHSRHRHVSCPPGLTGISAVVELPVARHLDDTARSNWPHAIQNTTTFSFQKRTECRNDRKEFRMLSNLKHMQERRTDLRKEINLAETFEQWEESCVPSYCHKNWLASYVSWQRLFKVIELAKKSRPEPKTSSRFRFFRW